MGTKDDNIVIAFDTKQMRPGCVILQAVFGGDRRAGTLFDASSWLVAPTDDMRLIRGSLAEWKALAATVNAKHQRPYKAGALA